MVPSGLKCPNGTHTGFQGRFGCLPERENPSSIWCWQLRFLLQEHVNSLQRVGKKCISSAFVEFDLLVLSLVSEVWQIKGDPIHKWCWRLARFFLNGSSTALVFSVWVVARFLWHATDVNTGATSVTKALLCDHVRELRADFNADPLIISMYLNRNAIGIKKIMTNVD